MAAAPLNIDLECAEAGQRIAGIAMMNESIITDALSVLETEGLYALFLWIEVQSSDRRKRTDTPHEELSRVLAEFLIEQSLLRREGQARDEILTSLQDLSSDLDNLLHANDLLRRVLIYARYHVKAKMNLTEVRAL